MRRRELYGIVPLVVFCLTAVPLRAELVSYEGFNYTAGQNLSGQNGGFGFNGGWFLPSSTTNYTIGSSSLGYGELETSGRRVNGARVFGSPTAWMRRSLPASREGPFNPDGSTLYFSLLMKPTGTSVTGTGFTALSIYNASQFGQIGQELTFGMDGAGTFGVGQLGGIGRVNSQVSPVLNQTAFLVLKAEFNADSNANDRFSLYVNPTSELDDRVAIKTDFNLGTINQLAIRSTSAFEIDEIRIGTTFASVAPVPEPSSGVLFLVATAAVVWRRRR